MTGDNSSKGLIMDNVFGDYADAADVSAVLNMSQRGLGTTKALTAQTAIYGTHWIDYFTSTTAGRLAIVMNEPTADTASQVTLANGAAFTSAGGLYMPTIGHSAIFETPDYIIGNTAFQNSALVMAGGTVGNYRFEYAIDKNDGAGYSAMTASSYTAAGLATALNGLSGLSAVNGFKLKLKITTTTTNATAITSVYLLTSSTTTTQAYQYPLDTATTTIGANVSLSGAEIRVYDLDDSPAGSLGTELFGTETNSGATFSYSTPSGNAVWLQVMLDGYEEYGIELETPTIDTTVNIILTAEENS
jgi:hypothetical protein